MMDKFLCVALGLAILNCDWVSSRKIDRRTAKDRSWHSYGGCADSEWTCNDGSCILPFWQCDHEEDCNDGSDERDCDFQCKEPFDFQCGDGSCLFTSFVCDGDYDCADGSDESDCASPPVLAHELVRTRVTQQQARSECARRGKTLLQVDDLDEQLAVTLLLESNYVTEYVWTDGKRENTACRCLFTWVTSGLPVRFTYWRLDASAFTVCQPDNYQNSEHCIHLVPEAGWQWNDISCEDEYYFICE